MHPLDRRGIDLIVAVGPAALFDQTLPVLVDALHDGEIGMFHLRTPLALRRTYPAVEDLGLRRPPRPLPLESLETDILRRRNLVHRVEIIDRIAAVGDLHHLLVFDKERYFAAFDDAHHRDLDGFAVLHVIDGLGIAVHIVAVNLVVEEVSRHGLARHLIVVRRIELADHHRTADELGPRELLVLGKNVHHVGGDLVVLVPQHGIDVEVDRRIGTDRRHRIAHGLEIRAVDLHVPEPFQQTVYAVAGRSQRVDRIGRDRHRRRVGQQRIDQQVQQRILLGHVEHDQRIEFAQGRRIDLNHPSFARRTRLTGLELRFRLQAARREPGFLALLLLQQPGRRFLLAPGRYLVQLLLFLLGGGRLFLGLGSLRRLFQQRLALGNGQRIRSIGQRIGRRRAAQRIGGSRSIRRVERRRRDMQ